MSTTPTAANRVESEDLEHEVLIVGAGFAGVYLLHKLRQQGFECRILEAGGEIGGTWALNTYPGARVDTNMPLYQLSIPEVYETWTWTTKYPAQKELREYFRHIDRVLGVAKDVHFGFRVISATYNRAQKKWKVVSGNGAAISGKFLILATGFAAKPIVPAWERLDQFKGEMFHSYRWPKSNIALNGKRVAIIGTGASGVQMAQEASKVAAHLTLFQRTPNLCLPMRQRMLNQEMQISQVHGLPDVFDHRLTTFAGYADDFRDRSIFEDSVNERERFFEQLWEEGGFKFWIANYKDVLTCKRANRIAYDFWSRKTRARIPDPVKRDLLAPLDPPHPWGVKRPCLETDYYEQLSKNHVTVVDLKSNPIANFEEGGIVTKDGKAHKFDLIGIATGYDALTGPMLQMGLTSGDGIPLEKKWASGVSTYLGTTMSGYPNLFFLFAVHGPTASNGPSCIELQGNWIVDTMIKMRKDNITSIEPTVDAERAWKRKVHELSKATLIHETGSWYNGDNVPGKLVEPLIFFGGFPMYKELCYDALETYSGFKVEHGLENMELLWEEMELRAIET